MKNNRGTTNWIMIVVIIIIILAIIGIVWYYNDKDTETETTSNANTNKQSDETTTNSNENGEEEDTTEVITYADETHNYNVSYPQSWSYEVCGENRVMFGEDEELCDNDSLTEYFAIVVYPDAASIDDPATIETDDAHLLDREEMSLTVADTNATRYSGQQATDADLGGGFYRDEVYFKYDDKGFAIKHYSELPIESDEEVFENLIESFNFSE